MIETKTRMSLMHFHDFYYLQALQAELMTEVARNPERRFSHSVERLQVDVQNAMDDIIPNMALRTFVYIFAACLGESRHARTNQAKFVYLPCTKPHGRGELFNMSTEFAPTPENLQALVDVFAQPWHSGFGGDAWHQIAEALQLYGTIPDTAWLDHVVDLEHNNGTVFNKDDARNTVQFQTGYEGKFSLFLDYKFSFNIIRQRGELWNDGDLSVTRKVYSLVSRFCQLFGVKFPDWLVPNLPRLGEYEVVWGDNTLVLEKKWCEWATINAKNAPSAPELLSMARLDDIYTPNYTKSQLAKKATKAKKFAIEAAGKYVTPKLVKEINTELKKWKAWAYTHCKPVKAQKTYKVLPAQVTFLSDSASAFIPLPHQKGYGEEVEGGFKVDLNMITSGFTNGWLASTFGGCINTHFALDYGHIVVQLPGYTISFTDKQLEALLD